MNALSILLYMGVPSAVTGFFFWMVQRNISKLDETRKKLDEIREENSFLVIKGISAAISLGEATAMAIRDGKNNGEITFALKQAREVKIEQKDFLTKQGVKNLI
jgi:preprotein translocase subunit YajC